MHDETQKCARTRTKREHGKALHLWRVVETQFSTGWYWPILRLMTTGLHSTTSPSCTQDTFPRSHLVRIVAHLRILLHIFAFSHIFTFHHASAYSIVHLCIPSHIFTFHHASSCSCTSLHSIAHLRILAHLRVPSRIFVFHRDLVRIIAGASINCPASSLVHRIPFITISDYVWHHTIIILLWTLTLHHLHT